LKAGLRKTWGETSKEIRAFAPPAVPSLQATVADKIVLTSFRPLQDEPVWDGHINAFLKPLPIDNNLRPDTSIPCSNDPDVDPRGKCFLWDSGAQLLTQVPNEPNDTIHLGDAADRRRVFYSKLDTTGTWKESPGVFHPRE